MAANPVVQLHGARSNRWIEAQAAVDSCRWVHDHDNLGNDAGHYDISFVYKAAGSDRHGTFCYPGCEHVTPYRPGEVIPIRFNRKKPGRYRLPWADGSSNYEKLEAILVILLFGLALGYAFIRF